METKNNVPFVVGHSAMPGPGSAEKNHAHIYISNLNVKGGGKVYFNMGGSELQTGEYKTSKKSRFWKNIKKVITYPFRRHRRSYNLVAAETRSTLLSGSNDASSSKGIRRCVIEHSKSDDVTRQQVYGSQSEIECDDIGLNGNIFGRSDEVLVQDYNDGGCNVDNTVNDIVNAQVEHAIIDKTDITSSWIHDILRNPAEKMQCRGEGFIMASFPESSDLSQIDSCELDDSSSIETPYHSEETQSKQRLQKFTNTHFKSPYERVPRFERFENVQSRPLVISSKAIIKGDMINRLSYSESLDSGVDCSLSDEDGYIAINNQQPNNKKQRQGVKVKMKRMPGRMKCGRNMSRKNKLKKILKNVVRTFHFNEQPHVLIYGLGSYFDRLNNAPPPSLEEQMRYEWLRLTSLQHYTGAGNSMNLARNGFYHRHTDGPMSTRCAYCDVTHSTWAYYDNVETVHRRISPDCTVGRNNPREYMDTQIGRTGNQSLFLSNRGSPVAVGIRVPNGIAVFSSSVREVCRPQDNVAIQATDPESVSGEVDTRDHADYLQDRALQYEADFTAHPPNTGGDHNNSTLYANEMPAGATADVEQAEIEEQETARKLVHANENNNGGVAACSAYSGNDSSIVRTGIEMANELHDSFATATQPRVNTSVSSAAEEIRESVQASGIQSSLNNTTTTSTTSNNGNERHQKSDIKSTAADDYSSQDQDVEESTQMSDTVNNNLSPPLLDNVKYPEYRTIAQRVLSFQGFPEHLDQTPEQMVFGGFFYVGSDDCVRCFSCGIGLKHWTAGDDPLIEHARWFPRCGYVLRLKGEQYVAAVQRRHQEHMEEQRRHPMEMAIKGVEPNTTLLSENELLHEMPACKICMERPINTTLSPCGHLVCCDMCASRLQHCPVCRREIQDLTGRRTPQSPALIRPAPSVPTLDNVKHPEYRTMAQRVNSFQGFPGHLKQTPVQLALAGFFFEGEADFTRCFYCGGGLRKWEPGDDPFVGHAKWYPSCRYIIDYKTRDRPRTSEEFVLNTDQTEDITTANHKSEAELENNTDCTTLREENKDMRRLLLCNVCMANTINTQILPCEHLVACETCAKELLECPICKKRIKQYRLVCG